MSSSVAGPAGGACQVPPAPATRPTPAPQDAERSSGRGGLRRRRRKRRRRLSAKRATGRAKVAARQSQAEGRSQ
eukprot:6774730-Lingulodinium_polyedra.AAC.1